ncbi:TonB-dependent receptor, partial [bacterium]|nr:TonB-dependent receptor [bacterium]
PYAGTLGRYRMYYWDPVRQEWRYYWITIEADRNSLRFPAYHRLDVGASKAWEFRWGTLTVRADIINLYNNKNVMLYYYDMSNEPPVQRKVTMIPFFPSVGVEVRF